MNLNSDVCHRRTSRILVFCMLALLFLLVSSSCANLHLNLGFIDLIRVKIHSNIDNDLFLRAEQNLQQAMYHTAVRQRALRGLGLLSVQSGEINRAKVALEEARNLNPQDLIVRIMLGDLYNQTGANWSAITEYEAIGYRSREHESAVNYLSLLHEGHYDDLNTQEHVLEKILELDPDNIVAAYRLLTQTGMGNEVSRADLIQKIRCFPMSQIYRAGDSGPYMANHLAYAIPELVEAGFWDIELSLRVVDWWLRVEYYEAAEIALTSLAHAHPSEPALGESLVRLYYEKGEWQKSITTAQEVLAIHPTSALAHRYMALSHEMMGDMVTANIWYSRYQQLAPDDWWAMELSEQQYRTEVITAVARLLELSLADVVLDEGVFLNTNFGVPGRWRFEVWTSEGTYGMNGISDEWIKPFMPLEEETAAAICGIWRETAYAGLKLQEQFLVERNIAYVLSFFYKVDGHQRYQCTLHSPALFSDKIWLPSTNGEWRLLVAVGSATIRRNQQNSLRIINGGIGCIDVTGIRLHELQVPTRFLDDSLYIVIRGPQDE